MKNRMLVALALVSVCLIPTHALAACVVSMWGTNYTLPNNSCNEVANTSWGQYAICFTLGPEIIHQNSDYVLAHSGRAWLVQGTKKTPFASARMDGEFTRLNAKYSDAKGATPKIKREREVAFKALFTKGDSGAVSDDVVSSFAKKMGLSVRQSEKSSGELRKRPQVDGGAVPLEKTHAERERSSNDTYMCPPGQKPPCTKPKEPWGKK